MSTGLHQPIVTRICVPGSPLFSLNNGHPRRPADLRLCGHCLEFRVFVKGLYSSMSKQKESQTLDKCFVTRWTVLVTSVNNHSNKSLQSCAPFSKFRLFTSQPDLMTDLTIVQGTDSAIRTLLINFYCEFPFQAPDMDGAVFRLN